MDKSTQLREKLHSLNCPINLGYFAKHLNYNNTIEKIEITDDNDIANMTIKLKKITKKYYKYKGKYMKTKTTTTSTNLNSNY